ncbi:MAG: DUF4405 domain-containing protein [Candidatus Aminicenantes bacterium]|nr:DUF4405 domain-containing protein [Candidatus Aminicenantes bacterium]MDH5383885.1 DUF4405 domain-containing protein [Candidatus Aminicenantes bacterium]MDH5742355.1 DUF4405 domain-containing protein [Candidatus Aminicenantes bacterium]
MKKADWQYLVDTLLFICIVGMALIGILLAFFIPKGPSALESSKYFLNLHRHQWGNIHLYLSLTFIFLVIIHLTLDWKWITTRAGKIFKKGWKTALFSTVLISIFVIFLFWFFYLKEPGAYEDHGVRAGRKEGRPYAQETSAAHREELGAQDQGYITITGKMTLDDLEKATNIPVAKITAALRLPSDVSREEILGRLGKKHGFSLVEVRDALTKLMSEDQEFSQKGLTADAQLPPQQHKAQPTHGQLEEEQKITRGRMDEDQSGILITGEMSLSEIEERTGVPTQKIIEKLSLPQNVSLQENIGRLRRRYRFTLQDVRDIVASLMKK